MRVMAVLWPWRREAPVLSRLTGLAGALLLFGCGLATAQIGDGAFESLEADGQRVSVLVEGTAFAVEQQATSPDSADSLPTPSARYLGPGRAFEVVPVQDIGFADAGLPIRVSFVLDPAAATAPEQLESLTSLVDALPDDVSLHLLLEFGEDWLEAGSFMAGDALEALDLAAASSRDPVPPAQILSDPEPHRHFVVLGYADQATENIGGLAAEASASVFAISTGFADTIPEGVSALGSLNVPGAAERLYDAAKAGRIQTYDFSETRRMPFEGAARIELSSGELTQMIVLDVKTYGLGHLINPLNIPAWITTPGRRWFAAITIFVWFGFGLFAYRLITAPRREEASDPILEVEIFFEGRTVEVFELPYRIGRAAENDIVIDDDATSRKHAEIRRDDMGALVFADLGSANGSFADGQPVNGTTPIGDELDVRVPTARLILRPA